MSTDHFGAIQRLAGDIVDHHDDDLETYAVTQEIIAHAAALADQLAEATARAGWNKRYAEALEDAIEADYGGDDTVEVILRMARAKASAAADLDAAPGDTDN